MIVFKAHSRTVYALEFSPDGRSLVTTGGDSTVRLWSQDPPTLVREWPGSNFHSPVAFSPDGRFVARGGYGVRAWPVEGPEEAVVSSDRFAESLAFSPDGRVLAAHGDSSEGLSRWAMPEGRTIEGGWGGNRASNEGLAFPTGGIAFDPSGALLATGFGVRGDGRYDSAIYLWDTGTGEQVGTLHNVSFASHMTAARFSPDGTLLAGVYGPVLRVWDVANRAEIAARNVGKKHLKGLAFMPDGRRLLTVSNDETVHVWDSSNWSERDGFAWKIGKLGAVAVSPDGCRIAAGGTGQVVIWDAD